MGKHSTDRHVVVGNYVRKPRARFSALTILTRLWVERNTDRRVREPFPNRNTITRHAVSRGEVSTLVRIDRERGR